MLGGGNKNRAIPVCRFGAVLVAALAAVFCCQPSGAKANTVQTITGTFDDGGALSGTFTFNQYGFLTAPWHLTTTAGASIPTNTTYGPGDVTGIVGYYLPPLYVTLVTLPDSFEVWNTTYGDRTLTLLFSSPDMGQPDTLLGGFECLASYACVDATHFDRELTSGSVINTPLPSTWSAMLIAFAGLGLVVYRRQKQTIVAT